MPDLSDLIGAPYSDLGRGPSYDCYGLVIEVLRRNGVNLPDIAENRSHDLLLCSERVSTMPVERIPEPEPLAILEMHIFGEFHIGIVVGKGVFMHATRNRGVILSQIRDYRIEGIYRVKKSQ